MVLCDASRGPQSQVLNRSCLHQLRSIEYIGLTKRALYKHLHRHWADLNLTPPRNTAYAKQNGFIRVSETIS